MRGLVLAGGRLIDPEAGIDGPRDLQIRDGRIRAVDRRGGLDSVADCTRIALDGCWVMPGLIDVHVHLRDPGFPEKETIASGLRAAAAGGFTAVAAMANTEPVNDCPEISRYMLARAAEVKDGARLVAVGAVSRGLAGLEPVNYEAMVLAGARLFSDDGTPVDDTALLTRAFSEVNSLGFAVSLHEEDRTLSGAGAANAGATATALGVPGVPAQSEVARVRRDLELALKTGAAAHIAHVSTVGAVQLVREAKGAGARVTCEVTPHHLALDEAALLRCGTNAKMSPPLRDRETVIALREAVADGTIDMIATDHAPHDPASKQMDALGGLFGPECSPALPLAAPLASAFCRAANGVIGLETAVGVVLQTLVHSGIINPVRMVELMAVDPAHLLRLEAATLKVGCAANITVIDPEARWVVEPQQMVSKSRNTPFSGMELQGRAMMTIVAGEVSFDGRHRSAAQ